MITAQALLYLAAVVLLMLAAIGVSARINLVLTAYAFALLAFALPVIATLWHA